MKIKSIALLGLAAMLASACSEDKATKGSLAVTVQIAADLTGVTTVQITALSEADFDAADATAAADSLADIDVSGTTLAQAVAELKAGTYRITATGYAGEATVAGATASMDVTIAADGVSLLALILSGSTDLVIGGITASNGAPKTGDTVTLTAAVSGNAGGSLVWTDNCDGDYASNGAAMVEWSSAFVETCTLTLTATNPATSATATLALSVGGQKGALERVVGTGFCNEEQVGQYDGHVDYYGGVAVTGHETARSFPMMSPAGIAIEGDGNLVFAEHRAGRVWRYSPSTDVLTRVAGNIDPNYVDGDWDASEGLASNATFEFPMGVAVNADGDIYINDIWEYRTTRVYADTATIAVAAGNGSGTFPVNGSLAYQTNSRAFDTAFDAQGNTYYGGTEFYNGYIAKVFAATQTTYTYPNTVNLDAWQIAHYDGEVYAVSRFFNYVWKINLTTGIVSDVAGDEANANVGNSDAGGDATQATFYDPRGIYIDQSNGNIFIADFGNSSIRMITQAGKISTVLNTPGAPADMVMDSAKNLYYTDRASCSVIKAYGPY